jgi:Mycobacterial cell wall arabinan synthesis protein/EmbC C-terminal domain/Arabinosyltransferase concanavalin like domain
VVSSAALFAPYRPAELTLTVPCSALRAAAARVGALTVLATGPPGDGLVLRTEAGTARLVLGSRVVSSVPVAGTTMECEMRLQAGPTGTVISQGDGRTVNLAGEPVPKVFALHTDLDPRQAAGLTVTARTADPFATSPTGVKILLIALQLLAALIALGLLSGVAGWGLLKGGQLPRWPPFKSPQLRWGTVTIDAGVLGVLAVWTVIGPLTDDDGFATTIARNAALTGNPGNYYRWWNAAETPFALGEQLLAPFTQLSVAPLWLRLPSTALGMATWFVLSRGILGAALPATAGTVRIRALAAVCLLAAWLPFNLGVRPEPYVATGLAGVLALLWRARGLASLGWAALVAGLTIPFSPSGLLVAAPVLMFAPRIVRMLRDGARSRTEVATRVLLLCAVAALGLTAIFADQTWDGLVTATRWHNFFGPALPWYHEPDRYSYLLGTDQDGSATKRVPVLLTLVLLPVVAAALLIRAEAASPDCLAARLAGVVVTALALLWLTPSKWSHHFGALAGLFAAFDVVAVSLLLRRTRLPILDRGSVAVGLAGTAGVAGAAGLAFAGSNGWWQPAAYDVPWAIGPVRPLALPLDSAVLWIGALALGYALLSAPDTLVALRVMRGGAHRGAAGHSRVLVAAPALLAVAASGTAVAVLLGSFLAAPLRRPAGSLAMANLRQLAGDSSCGLADDVQVLPDGAVLPLAENSPGRQDGFIALGGFDPGSPPPDPPGTGMSTQLWGSLVRGPQSTGSLTSPWFRLPTLGPADGVGVSVSGRTDRGNKLTLEFGRSLGARVLPLGEQTPFDLVKQDQDRLDGPLDYRPWRSIGLDAAELPPHADRVRINAVDASTDPDGWLAVTAPRLRSVAGLSEFLATHGPVLVSWPQAFLFPCVHNIPRVAGGLAEAPRTVIEAPRRHGRLSAITTDQTQGGVFAAIRPFGHLYEVPTRLIGHPGIDWGALQLSATRDAYQVQHGDISGSEESR